MMHFSSLPPIIFSGNSHKELVRLVCDHLKVEQGKIEVFSFSNSNTFVRILENVRQRDVFVVQPTALPANESIMEMLIMVDAIKRASAGRITAVIPYFSYARTDKKDQPRVPITGRLVADLIKTAGADRALLFDLHAGQVQGFFSFPVDELTAMRMQTKYFKQKGVDNLTVAATDVGISKKARDFALALDVPLIIVEKRRLGNNERIVTNNVIGDALGKKVVLFDDEINSGESMIAAANALIEHGAESISICATHGVFTKTALKNLQEMDLIDEIVVTNTLPQEGNKNEKKLKVMSVAPLVGEAIRSIHEGSSVGALFK